MTNLMRTASSGTAGETLAKDILCHPKEWALRKPGVLRNAEHSRRVASWEQTLLSPVSIKPLTSSLQNSQVESQESFSKTSACCHASTLLRFHLIQLSRLSTELLHSLIWKKKKKSWLFKEKCAWVNTLISSACQKNRGCKGDDAELLSETGECWSDVMMSWGEQQLRRKKVSAFIQHVQE